MDYLKHLIDTATHEGKKNDRKKECYEQNVEIHQKIWDSLSKNFETIECAQLSNSFITRGSGRRKGSMSSTQISELIANKQGQIYKDCATLRLFRTWTKKRRIHNSKEIKKLYSITPKG